MSSYFLCVKLIQTLQFQNIFRRGMRLSPDPPAACGGSTGEKRPDAGISTYNWTTVYK